MLFVLYRTFRALVATVAGATKPTSRSSCGSYPTKATSSRDSQAT